MLVMVSSKRSPLARRSLWAAKIQFGFAIVYTATTAAFDAWKLLPDTAMENRWAVSGLLLIVSALIWLAATQSVKENAYFKMLIYGMIVLDLSVIAFSVYSQRGMASRAVALFAIPILISTVLKKGSAIIATTALCIATYTFSVVRYFYTHPSEGYKIELYGDVFFYSSIFILMATLLWQVIRPDNQ
jgi:hypothetical protein